MKTRPRAPRQPRVRPPRATACCGREPRLSKDSPGPPQQAAFRPAGPAGARQQRGMRSRERQKPLTHDRSCQRSSAFMPSASRQGAGRGFALQRLKCSTPRYSTASASVASRSGWFSASCEAWHFRAASFSGANAATSDHDVRGPRVQPERAGRIPRAARMPTGSGGGRPRRRAPSRPRAGLPRRAGGPRRRAPGRTRTRADTTRNDPGASTTRPGRRSRSGPD